MGEYKLISDNKINAPSTLTGIIIEIYEPFYIINSGGYKTKIHIYNHTSIYNHISILK